MRCTPVTTLDYRSRYNQKTIGRIANYYAKTIGISGPIGTGNKAPKDGGRAIAFTNTSTKRIDINIEGGIIGQYLNNANDFKSILIHEDNHRTNGHTNLDHVGVYINQISDNTWNNVSVEYKKNTVNNIQKYLNLAIQNGENEDWLKGSIDVLNSQDITEKTGVNYFYDSENKTVSAQAVYELPEFVVTE